MKPLCIYHADCADGFAAAWVVRKAFDGEVDFHAGVYGDAPPVVAERDVFIVDFSYPRATLMQMISDAESLTIIDHHVSAQAALADLPGAIVRFNLNHSGCVLTWQYFFQEEPPPKLLRDIEDYDLWRFNRVGSKEIMAYLRSFPQSFTHYDRLCALTLLGDVIDEGNALLRQRRHDLDTLLPLVTRPMMICGHNVPVANLPHIFASEAGARLSSGQPFAATYWDGPHYRTFSLRSTAPDGADVSLIAQRYGGGGHRHAAGFRVDRKTAWLMECDECARSISPSIAKPPG